MPSTVIECDVEPDDSLRVGAAEVVADPTADEVPVVGDVPVMVVDGPGLEPVVRRTAQADKNTATTATPIKIETLWIAMCRPDMLPLEHSNVRY